MMGTTSLYTQARRLALTAGALLTCSLLIGPASFARTSAVVTVSLTDTAPPSPAVANVAPGDSITFVNTGKENHDIVSARAGFTTPVLLPGQSASVTMNTIGKFTYKQTGFTHSFSGSIVVASPSAHGRLTLTSSNAFVPYGFRTTLHVSTSLSDGTPLVLFSSRTAGTHAPRKCVATAGGQAPTLPSGWVRASAPVAVSGGAVAFGVRPAAATSYRVTTADGAACSGAVVVKVRPRLTIRLSAAHVASGHQITATGTVAPARSVSALVLSRFNPATSSWQKVATAPTSTHGTSRFIFVVPAGATRLEINTGRSGGSRGAYLPATSPSLVVHGVGPAPASHSAHHKR